ncbi:MAG: hypothetical protein R3E01_30855 [Pirellulaceae bacterium]
MVYKDQKFSRYSYSLRVMIVGTAVFAAFCAYLSSVRSYYVKQHLNLAEFAKRTNSTIHIYEELTDWRAFVVPNDSRATKVGLILDRDPVDSDMWEFLSKCSQIVHLDTCLNKIGDDGLRRITSNCCNLRSLYICDADVSPDGLSTLKMLPDLRTLKLFSDDLYKEGAGESFDTHLLSSLNGLEDLSLEVPGIDGASFRRVGPSKSLRRLKIEGNALNGGDLSSLTRFVNLEELALGFREVPIDELVYSVGRLPKLKILRMPYIELSSGEISRFSDETNVEELFSKGESKLTVVSDLSFPCPVAINGDGAERKVDLASELPILTLTPAGGSMPRPGCTTTGIGIIIHSSGGLCHATG